MNLSIKETSLFKLRVNSDRTAYVLEAIQGPEKIELTPDRAIHEFQLKGDVTALSDPEFDETARQIARTVRLR